MLACQHFTGTTKTCHDFICNQIDFMLTRPLLQTSQKIFAINTHAAGALYNRLYNHCGNAIGDCLKVTFNPPPMPFATMPADDIFIANIWYSYKLSFK